MKKFALVALVAALTLSFSFLSAATAKAAELPAGFAAASETTPTLQALDLAPLASDSFVTSGAGTPGEGGSWLGLADNVCTVPPGCLNPKGYCGCMLRGAWEALCRVSNCNE